MNLALLFPAEASRGVRGSGMRGAVVLFSLFALFRRPQAGPGNGVKMVAYPIENIRENTMFWVPIKVALKGPIGYKNVTRFVRVFAFVRPGKRAAERKRRR
jgi:hypothetical protein